MQTIYFAVVFGFIKSVSSCGILTHIEISHRAQEYFKDESHSAVDYGKLILKHQDALVAGSPYPDSFYDSICAGGQYHYVSEDTHWAPFLNASVSYIRKKYPQPWDEATEKLVVFMFGVVSHQVADILWHSLGIDQGFLATMGKINFHGSFDKAHSVGDFGGDVLSNYEFPIDYLNLTEGWYVPTEDLYNIYQEYYNGSFPMPKATLLECGSFMIVGRLAEILGARELFPEIAYKSPYLVDQFEKYFIGGVDDMAGWIDRIWQQTITMFEQGPSDCSIPKSTLFLDCQGTPPDTSPSNRYPLKNGYYYQRPQGVSSDDIIVEKYLRGVRVKPSQRVLNRIKEKQELKKESEMYSKKKLVNDNGPIREPDHVLYVKNAYAKLGEAYATGDLNFDGKPDLVLTAPGYGSSGSPQEGRVYIVYGGDDGITTEDSVDLDSLLPNQVQIVKGWGTAQARLGMSVAVVDVNLDGADDLAVGGPSFVMTFSDDDATPLDYQGYVMIYFGNPKKHEVARGAANITIFCQKFRYCNLGFSMTAGDVNNDGYPDLVFGSPFAPEGGEQRGFVAALISSKHNFGYQTMDVTDLTWKKSGTQDYGWFGYDFFFYSWFNRNHMFVSQPEYRLCKNPDCSYSQNDTQSVGRMVVYDLGPSPQQQPKHFTGTQEFQQTGWSAAAGKPYGNFPDTLALTDLGYDVAGKVAGGSVTFLQSGRVRIYNISSDIPVKRTWFDGDRMFGRFGGKVKLFDLNNDTVDDLLIGATYRSDDVTEEIYRGEQGLVVIYHGGKTFPFEDGTGNCGNSFIHPCPRYTASETLTWFKEASQTRFGTNMAFMTFKNKRQLFVTAEHESTYQRLAGAVGIFDY